MDESGKESSSLFRYLSYSEELDQSIVLCTPLTGRQHQLRVHLAHLGHPIVKDRTYSLKDSQVSMQDSSCTSGTVNSYPGEYEKDEICEECIRTPPIAEESPFEEIYLHAYFYSIAPPEPFSCRSPLPQWSVEPSFHPLLTDEHPLLSEELLLGTQKSHSE